MFEVIMKKQRCFFIIVYRPPNISILHLRSAVDYMCLRSQAESQTMFLLGHLDIDFCKENNPLQCILDDYGLTNVVHGATCYKKSR